MAWLQKHKTLVTVSIILIFLLLATLSCSTEFATEPGQTDGLSCDQLRLEYADGQELSRELAASGKSFLSFIEEDTADSVMGRLFFRLLVWNSGRREAAEKVATDGHMAHMTALEEALAARCR